MRDFTPTTPSLAAKLAAEGFGTFILVIAVVGTALFAAGFGEGTDAQGRGVGFLGVSLAAGLAVTVGVYAFGPLSGGHFNPAVTLGIAAAGRMPWRDVPPYLVAQLVGGVAATTVLVLIGLFAPEGWLTTAQDGGFASNGWDALSPGGFGMVAAIVVEVVFTAIFLLVILATTHARRGTPFAGLAIGLTLTLIHLVTIPVDNTSMNPARSLATAIYGNADTLTQVWAFLVFPVAGAMLAGFAFKALFDGTVAETPPVDDGQPATS